MTLATPPNKSGFALLLKWFEILGRFHQRQSEFPVTATAFVAKQLSLEPEDFTDEDKQALSTWLLKG